MTNSRVTNPKVPSFRATIVGLCVFFLVLLVVLANLPVRIFIGDSIQSVSHTDLQTASFLKGDLWVDLEEIPGLTHLVYNWCPGLSPLNWCIDLKHNAFDITGQAAVSGLKHISLSEVNIQSLDMTVLGISSDLIDVRVNGQIDSVTFPLSGCPIKNIEALEGRLVAENIKIFGISTGAHQLIFNTVESAIDAQLSGDAFLGRIQLNKGKYTAEGEMMAPETMAGIAQSFMTPLGDNRFGWEISGDLPC